MINLPGLQAIVNQFMVTPVTIQHLSASAQDPGNRTGDDILGYEPTTTDHLGWFVDKGTRTFSQGGGMSVVADEPTLRLPVGTDIKPRDKVLIGANWWAVIDASGDETWPVMMKVEIARLK